MSQATTFLEGYGGTLVFGAVLAEQLGLPVPASPILLAAGALAAGGSLNLTQIVILTVLACLIGDLAWFQLGRRRGSRMLGLICRLSATPDTCTRRTSDVFERYGMYAVAASKFVPGLGMLMPPLAGIFGVSMRRFLVYDGIGSLVYCGCFILLGFAFREQLAPMGTVLARQGSGVLLLVAGFGVAYGAIKYVKRHRLLRHLSMARITVDELRRKQEAGEDLVIIDLRPLMQLRADPFVIPGARHVQPDDVLHRHHELPRDCDVVLYCSCPNEITSAHVALLLQRKGLTRVWPLLGGLADWRERNYPTEPIRWNSGLETV